MAAALRSSVGSTASGRKEPFADVDVAAAAASSTAGAVAEVVEVVEVVLAGLLVEE